MLTSCASASWPLSPALERKKETLWEFLTLAFRLWARHHDGRLSRALQHAARNNSELQPGSLPRSRCPGRVYAPRLRGLSDTTKRCHDRIPAARARNLLRCSCLRLSVSAASFSLLGYKRRGLSPDVTLTTEPLRAPYAQAIPLARLDHRLEPGQPPGYNRLGCLETVASFDGRAFRRRPDSPFQ